MTFDLAQLDRHTGSETFYRHGLVRSITYTEGVKHLADGAGAHWLLDKIATNQITPALKHEEFQVWNLTVKEGNKAILSCEDGNDTVIHVETIDFTDFPAPGVTVWLTNKTMLLPSEY